MTSHERVRRRIMGPVSIAVMLLALSTVAYADKTKKQTGPDNDREATAPGPNADDAKIARDCTNTFNELSVKYYPIERIAQQNGRELGWGESYHLMACVSMYEGTGDVEYLKKAMLRIDEVLKARDDKK